MPVVAECAGELPTFQEAKGPKRMGRMQCPELDICAPTLVRGGVALATPRVRPLSRHPATTTPIGKGYEYSGLDDWDHAEALQGA